MVDSVSSQAISQSQSSFQSDSLVDLLRRYDKQGPRYTSYPPATEFNAMTPQEYLAAIGNEEKQDIDNISPLSLYIHIPFCASPCFYCGCNKIITQNRSSVREYLDHLQKEMALIRLQMDVYKRPVTQLHWGGGTPTFLDDAEMTELMHQTANYFNVSNQESRDYSIEVDPRSVTCERIDLLRGLGFNRISLGVQDFDASVQKAINREQSVELAKELTDYIRVKDFRSLNFDLIYGLPLQTVDSIRQTLQTVIDLNPDRISYYNYAHLPDRFAAQKAIKEEDLPAAEEKLQMLSLIIETLTAAGYLYIGMDHFVKPGDLLAQAKEAGTLCRNFQGYSVTKARDLIGLGVSSISDVQGVFGQNVTTLDAYYKTLDNNQLPIFKGRSITDEDTLRSDLIQRLTCYREVDIEQFEQQYQIEFTSHFAEALPELEQFVADGLLTWEENFLRITSQGSLLLRSICMAFDEYLAQRSVSSSREPLERPRFSRII